MALFLPLAATGFDLNLNYQSILLSISILTLIIAAYALAAYLLEEFIADNSNKYQNLGFILFILLIYFLLKSDFFIQVFNLISNLSTAEFKLSDLSLLNEAGWRFIMLKLAAFQALFWAVSIVMLFIALLELTAYWIVNNYQIKCSFKAFRTVLIVLCLLNFPTLVSYV